jgi:hypothetical protein
VSTILKALKQLEDEKRGEPELTLSQQISMTTPPEPTGHRRAWVLAASATAGFAVAGAAVFFWLDPGSAPDAEQQAVAATPAVAPVPPKPKSRASRQLARARSDVSATGSISKTDPRQTTKKTRTAPPSQSPTESKVQVVKRVSPTSTPKPEPKTRTERQKSAAPQKEFIRRERHTVPSDSAAKTQEIASVESTAPARPSTASRTPTTQSGAPSSDRTTATKRGAPPKGSKPPERTRSTGTVSARVAAAAATEPAPAQETPPRPAAHPQTTKTASPPPTASKPATGSAVEPDHQVVLRAKLPDLRVRSTIWHPQGSRRVAMVEVDAGGVIELSEGDVVGPLVVESIKPGGVVFGHDGVSVLHKVGR